MIAAAFTVLLAAAAGLLALPLLSDLVSLLSRRHDAPGSAHDTRGFSRLLFLVPAHNEAPHIAACVASLVAMDYPRSARRVVVIADNCEDDTATRARLAGAECLERRDPDNPGKPQALAWALAQMSLDAWDACVIVDADSTVDAAFARGLHQEGPLSGRLAQAYFGSLNERESWLTRLAGVLTRCRYEVTYPLKGRAGLNCPMTGNGMCIGAELLRVDGWRAFSLTENWELFASYTAAGVTIRYARAARLRAQEAHALGGAVTQRRRWLAGRLWVLRRWAGPLITSRRIGWHQKLDALCELGAPSPVLHLLVAVAVAGVALAGLHGSAAVAIAGVALGSLTTHVIATLLVLRAHPEPWKTVAAFMMLPIYALWRAGVVLLTLATLRDQRWRKTEHHFTPVEPA